MSARNAWAVLGIAPTTDTMVIRAAYAACLKKTNPEDDAEGFKELRSAYERALQEASWRTQYPEDYADADDEDEGGDSEETVNEQAGGEDVVSEQVGADSAVEIEVDPNDVVTYPVDEPEASYSPPPHDQADPELAEHYTARSRLMDALARGAPADEIVAAYDGVFRSSAMQRVGVYVDTETWMVQVLHRMLPASEALIDRTIADFGWTDADAQIRRDAGSAVLALRARLFNEKAGERFLARVSNPKHEFHTAWKLLSKPMDQTNALGRFISLRHAGVVLRLLVYMEDRVHAGFGRVDYAMLEWWRGRIHALNWFLKWGSRGVITVFFVGLLMYEGVVGGAFNRPRPAGPQWSSENPLLPNRQPAAKPTSRPQVIMRCRDTAHSMPSAEEGREVCEKALEFAPDSLVLQQLAGLHALRAAEFDAALVHFRAIRKLSPYDPVARYAEAYAMSISDDAATAKKGKDEMLRISKRNIAVEAYVIHFASMAVSDNTVRPPGSALTQRRFGRVVTAPPIVSGVPVFAAPEEHLRPGQEFDTPAGKITRTTEVEQETLKYFELNRTPDGGYAKLECLSRSNNTISDCIILEENPLNDGRGELAKRLLENSTMPAATLAGAKVDKVPFKIRFSFGDDPGASAAPKGDRPLPPMIVPPPTIVPPSPNNDAPDANGQPTGERSVEGNDDKSGDQ